MTGQTTDWQKLIREAQTPEQKSAVLKKILAAADTELRDKGLSESEREALLAEIMHGDDDE